MLTLNDGRSELWQWDTGRTLTVDADCSQVHFSNKVFGRSIDVDVVGGVAIIPDILLQTDKDLNIWAFVGTAESGYTKISKTFKVNRRNKPADYVFTPADQITLQTIQSQIGDLSGLTTEAKDTLVAAINEAARTGGGGGGSTVELDTTLSEAGKAADAKAVGDALASKQDTISDLEAIRTGAAKGATALQSVPNTYRTASEQDTIDSGKVDKVTGKGLSSNDYTDAAKAKVDAIAPVATSGSYNDLTDKPTIPTTLPNPNALTFTGAVTGTYDGSAPLTVNIPSGEGGGYVDKKLRHIATVAVTSGTTSYSVTADFDGNSFSLQDVYILVSSYFGPDGSYVQVKLNNKEFTRAYGASGSPQAFALEKMGELQKFTNIPKPSNVGISIGDYYNGKSTVTSIYFWASSSTVDTTIEIYGVDA